MKVEIFIVSHAKDLPYLRWCLRSIQKFGKGFSGVRVLWPTAQKEALEPLALSMGLDVVFCFYDEFAPKGMLDHEAQILSADCWCPEADFVCHVDSDCLFVEPFSPEDYFINGKPVLLKESYARLKTVHPGRYAWKAVTEEALGCPVQFETMCRHPMVNPRAVYAAHREHIERRWKLDLRTYYLAGKNEFPQDRAEFNSLGAFALMVCDDLYHWIEVPKEARPKDKLIQFWSHGRIDQLQRIWLDGAEINVVPELLIKEIMGDANA